MPDAPLPISAYIRTKNEARMVARVVEAARLVADEVIVVDSGSSDDTVKLAEDAGARVIHQEWLGWGKQKRVAEDAAKHDWLLDLDADEIVTPDFAAEVRALFANGPPAPVAFKTMLVTVPPTDVPQYGYNLAPRTKLYDKTRIRVPDHEGWDQLELPRGVKLGVMRAPLLHYSFKDLAQLESKFNSNSTLSAQNRKPKAMWALALRLTFGAPIYFLRYFLGRSLWRGGLYGYVIACMAAHGRWLRDAKMLEAKLLQRSRDNPS